MPNDLLESIIVILCLHYANINTAYQFRAIGVVHLASSAVTRPVWELIKLVKQFTVVTK